MIFRTSRLVGYVIIPWRVHSLTRWLDPGSLGFTNLITLPETNIAPEKDGAQ